MIPEPPFAQPRPLSRAVRRRRVLVSIVGAAALAAGSTAAWYSYALGGSGEGKSVRVVVEEGSSARTIADELEDAGVIRSAFAFRLHVRFNGLGGGLKPGAYDLRAGLGAAAALDALREGIPLDVFRFTIPEGRALRQIAQIIGDATPISSKAFLSAATSGRHRSSVAPKTVNLEGLLWPDTYEIAEDATADDVVELLVTTFEQRAKTIGLEEGAARLGVSPYEAVIVASLIEREARTQVDRPKISSVIYNRLALPMRLQIDATVQYLLFLRDGAWPERILFRDLEIMSPYNTYRSDGLPPSPIASAGLSALRAAIQPADTDFLFYVACGPDGSHAFGRTAGDHQRNIDRCR